MGLLRFLALGAAVAVGVNYVTKRRPDGTSILDDLTAKSPEWMDKAKEFGDQVKDRYSQYSGQVEDRFAQQSETRESTTQGSTNF
ncbi:MAG TPA: hypothetical protein VNI52_01255 [Sphingobacteriaceae bacterium]|nr:hypothetical protein [Sphingobacteriaceae bacterium]